MLIIFYRIKQGENNMILSDSIVALFLLQDHPLNHPAQEIVNKINGILMEIGLEIWGILAIQEITGINIKIIPDKIIKITFTKNSGIEMEVDIRRERTIEVEVAWVAERRTSNRSFNKCFDSSKSMLSSLGRIRRNIIDKDRSSGRNMIKIIIIRIVERIMILISKSFTIPILVR